MNKTAIVLAGGGSRGAYQIGVWKALREMGIDYQLVTGTSVGALNGVLMVQQEYDKALAVWENISSQQVLGDICLLYTSRLPMIGPVRSLNLSNTVAIAVYETLRQWGFPALQNEGQLHQFCWDDPISFD